MLCFSTVRTVFRQEIVSEPPVYWLLSSRYRLAASPDQLSTSPVLPTEDLYRTAGWTTPLPSSSYSQRGLNDCAGLVSRLNIDLRERILGKPDLMALGLGAGLPNTWAPDESLVIRPSLHSPGILGIRNWLESPPLGWG